MSHVLRHDITAYCGGGAKHDQNGNKLVVGKAKSDSYGKEDSTKAHQLQKGAGYSCLWSGKCFSEMKGASHCYQTKRCSCFSQIIYSAG